MSSETIDLSKIPRRNTRIGLREYVIYYLKSGTPEISSLERLVLILMEIVSHNSIGLVEDDLANYGCNSEDKRRVEPLEWAVSNLAASVPGSIVIRFSNDPIAQNVKAETDEGFLVTTKGLGRFLVAQYGDALPQNHYKYSPERASIAELQAFKHLWTPPLSPEDLLLKSDLLKRIRFTVIRNTGCILGRIHSIRSLHGDYHMGNLFVKDNLQVSLLDLETAQFPLRDLTSAEYASDFAPILLELTPEDWVWFKKGASFQIAKIATLHFFGGVQTQVNINSHFAPLEAILGAFCAPFGS